MANNIEIKVSANVSSAVQGINQVNQKLDVMVSAVDRGRQRLSSLASTVISVTSVVGTVASVIGAVADAVAGLVSAYSAQEQAEIKLQGVLTATAGAVGMSAAEMLDLADSLQKVTTYSDQEIIAVEQVLAATRKIGRDVMPEATKAVLDMAAATGDDAAGAAKDLAQALADPAGEIESLKEKGIQLTEAQAENIRKVQEQNGLYEAQLLLLKEVEGTYGGIAEALADTDTGKLQQLQNAWNDLKEGLGEMLMNSIDGLVSYTIDLVRRIEGVVSDGIATYEEMQFASDFLASGDVSGVYSLTDDQLARVLENGIYKGLYSDIKAGAEYDLNPETMQGLKVYEAALAEAEFRKMVAQSNDPSHAATMYNERVLMQRQAEMEAAASAAAQQAAVEAAEAIISGNSTLSITARLKELDEQIAATQSAIDELVNTGADVSDDTLTMLDEIISGLEEQKSALKAVSSEPITAPVITHAASSSSTWLSSNSGLSTTAMLDDVNSRIWSGTQELSALEHAGKSGSSEYVYIQESIAALRQQKAALEEANRAAEDGAGAASGWVQAWTKALPVTQTLVDGILDFGESLSDALASFADHAAESLDSVTSKWDEYFDELDRKEERQSESLAAMLASGAISYEDYIEAMNSLDETRAEKEAEAAEEEEKAREEANNLGKAAFIAQQANAIAGATMSGAQAIMQVWADATLPTWAKGVQTGLVAATLATQIAAISAQQYTPLAAGGIVTSPTYALLGEGGAKEAVLPLTDYNLERTGLGRSEGTIQVIVNVGANYSQGQLAEEVFRGIEMAQRTGALPKWRYA